ncbi:GTP 3',8-cyclase MoaA [Vulcanococcus limneticus]|uniref:GTP 3',8-cyclase MoaA n=1 Tax=Vulcanococcus limneticus TaxID=2170428 RepID=UPI00398BCFB7
MAAPSTAFPPLDRHGRPPGVLRLSLTARCNLACPYCLPDDRDPPGLLSTAERVALVTAAVGLGVHSLRLTGGEPLLHPRLEELIAALRPLREAGGLREIALTSNGSLLSAARARALRAAGLDRITLSLDGADGASVARMAGLEAAAPGPGETLLARVLAAIEHARAAGFDPAAGQLKLNSVIARGRNDDQLLPLAALARERGLELRLIEFMDVGSRNGWSPEQVLPAAEMVRRIGARWPLEPLGRPSHGTASRWRYCDGGDPEGQARGPGGSQLAVVASISAPFCGDCNRLRITADGVVYTCLFAASGTDLKPVLRGGAAGPDTADLSQALSALWRRRDDRYSEERSAALAGGAGPGSASPQPHAEMAYLGG